MRGSLTAWSRWLIVLLAFVVAFPVALNNLVLALFLFVALPLHGGRVWAVLRDNIVARAATMLFGALVLGIVFGTTSLEAGIDILGKYADLAIIPLFILALRDESTRQRALYAFIASMVLIALVSWLIGLHIIPNNDWVQKHVLSSSSTLQNPSVFHSHITQGMLLAYAAYLFALRFLDATDMRKRAMYAGMALLMASNVLFLIQGRTGYVVLLALSVWLGWIALGARLARLGKKLTWRHGITALLFPILLLWIADATVPRLHDRMLKTTDEFNSWKPHVIKEANSIGDRMEFYYNSLAIVAEHPWLGVGTGGFEAAYEKQVRGLGIVVSNNPHDEYLLITIQIGVFGLLLLLYLFYSQWRSATRLPTPFEQNAARGLVLTLAVSCLFNSNLRDHVPGMFFALMSALWFAHLGEGARNA